MTISSYLKEKQPLVYKTFANALSQGRLSHAYLLCGEEGTPLKKTARYLAKSILCDAPSPLADETCRTCKRVEEGAYPDYVEIDGSDASIKKEEMALLMANFAKTPLEKKGIMVYVVHEVENMTIEAINSILKFLEEPQEGTYAILTTRNEAKILPTILSRCQVIRLLLLPREEVIQEALALGMEKKDAEILSFFLNDANLMKEEAESDEYLAAKSALETTLEALTKGKKGARFVIEKSVIPLLNGKKALRRYLDLLALSFQDALSLSRQGPIALSSYREDIGYLLPEIPHLDQALLAIMTLRGDVDANINPGLLLAHLITLIYQE